jgi:hypothetical protein
LAAILNLSLVELLRQSGSAERGRPRRRSSNLGSGIPELLDDPPKAYLALGPSNWAERTAYIGVLRCSGGGSGCLQASTGNKPDSSRRKAAFRWPDLPARLDEESSGSSWALHPDGVLGSAHLLPAAGS